MLASIAAEEYAMWKGEIETVSREEVAMKIYEGV